MDASVAGESVRRLRLLFVVPFPPRLDSAHGGRVVAQLLHRLADRHEVALLCLREPGDAPVDPELAARLAQVREVRVAPHAFGGPAWRHRGRMATMTVTRRPARVAVAYSPRMVRAAVRLARRFAPDVIQIEDDSLAYLAPRLRRPGRPLVLVVHDPGLGVASGRAQVTAGRQAAAHRYDTRMWRAYWQRTLPAATELVVFTESDAALLRGELPGAPVSVIALGIDLPETAADPLGAQPPRVLFVGGYNHPPNADAALRLIGEIMPAVRRALPELPLVLVGPDPSAEMSAAAGPLDTITGRVASVAPYVRDATLLALPIELGGGMRVKLLEAMAAGKAVVASPLAAAGLATTDGRELVIADGSEATARAIVALVSDPQARRALALAARAWAEGNLSWDARVSDYEALYRRVAARSHR